MHNGTLSQLSQLLCFRKFPLYRPGGLKHYVELHKFIVFTQMQDEVFPVNLALKYARSS